MATTHNSPAKFRSFPERTLLFHNNSPLILHYSGLLKFHAVAEPRNSGISAKSREIDKNTRNTAKFA